LEAEGLAPGTHRVTARYLGDDVFDPAVSPVLAQVVDSARAKAASVGVAKAQRGKSPSVLLTITARSLRDDYKVAGRKVTVLVRGKKAGTARLDAKGVAKYRIPVGKLRVGRNPVLVRFHSEHRVYVDSYSKNLVVTRYRVEAARVTAVYAQDPASGGLAVGVKAKRLYAGYAVSARRVEAWVNGKRVASDRTDTAGRASLSVGRAALKPGVNSVHIRYRPGSRHWRATITATYRVRCSSSGRVIAITRAEPAKASPPKPKGRES